ncbi:NAD(P)-binding domain-containing protein [Streptomyces sp. NPDC004647]|uniref:NADPH-dependent F420 reductase n=1 Tax=Streptomyces sp. NPDC004647 TaxID=3154671 RepID=UPI0033B7E3F0
MIVTIVGSGRMARGIAIRALVGGNAVRLTDHNPAKAQTLANELGQVVKGANVEATGPGGVAGVDLVVMAVPYPAGRDVAASLGDELSGAVVVDISNPVDFSTFDSLAVPPGTSAAEEIAAAASSARVVKAFNTTFAGTLIGGKVAGQPLDVFIAGDDEAAKATVVELVRSGGMRPLDVGPLRRARELEAFQFLHMAAQERLDLNFSSAIKILP